MKLENLIFPLNSGKLKQLSNIVILHDVSNNSVAPNLSNRNSPLSTLQLIEILRQQRERIVSLIYCQRIGTTCIGFELRQTCNLVTNVKKHLRSKRRRLAFSEEIRQLHPLLPLEGALFLTMRTDSIDLCKLVSRRGRRG